MYNEYIENKVESEKKTACLIFLYLITGCSSSNSQQNNTPTQIINGCPPNQLVIAKEGNVKYPEIDVVSAASILQGEKLMVVIKLKNIPEKITFNSPGAENGSIEYVWGVDIDIDGNSATGNEGLSGCNGIDYILHAIALPKYGNPKTLPLSSVLEAIVGKFENNSFTTISEATVQVSLVEKTIGLLGTIPGITTKSNLCFVTYKLIDLDSVQDVVGCQ